MKQNTNQQHKTCGNCQKSLPLTEFYQIRAKSKELRWEKLCKSCKKSRRQRKFKELKRIESYKKPRKKTHSIAPRIIEPRNRETEQLVKDIDFTNLERVYGRELKDSEKYAAVQNFNEFISILREEYSKIVGYDVYIRKED